MARPKKNVAAAAAKVEAPKTESVKAVVAPVANETVKKENEEKATVKEAAVKKETVKKETAKKEPAKKTTGKRGTAKKAELKSEVHIQFEGKSYSQDDLMKMAKDVWKYDLKQKVGELVSVELYVKPEENMVYYVMNKEFSGSFYI